MELYTSPSRYHTIDETVRLWNGFLPRDEQFAPAGETEEEREQREQETYLHARFYKEEQRYNDSYNPKLKTQNFVYPSAADCKVDPARPTIMLNTGVDIISPPAPPKAKPAIMSFDTIKKRRRKRLADKTWIKDSILTQRDHVRKLEFVEIQRIKTSYWRSTSPASRRTRRSTTSCSSTRARRWYTLCPGSVRMRSRCWRQ